MYTYAGRSSSDILDNSVEWRTESKALDKSRDMTMTYGLAWSRLVMVWRREMMAADVEPVGRKANCCFSVVRRVYKIIIKLLNLSF